MTSPGAGALIEADAIVLAVQPHREDDLFVRALVRDHGVLGLHAARARKAGRRHAGVLQPFVLGYLQADERRILRRLDPLPALGASRLAREPVRFWCAHLLAESALPLVHDGADAPFDDLWRAFLDLHTRADLVPVDFLTDALGVLLRAAGLLAPSGERRDVLGELVRVVEGYVGRPLLAWRDAGDWLR
jgi:recombinational DNA repair protein (RecF pathway)